MQEQSKEGTGKTSLLLLVRLLLFVCFDLFCFYGMFSTSSRSTTFLHVCNDDKAFTLPMVLYLATHTITSLATYQRIRSQASTYQCTRSQVSTYQHTRSQVSTYQHT